MLLQIMDKGTISAPKLAEHFDVSVRTIYRDIDALCAAGIPVYVTTGRNGGVKLLDGFVLDKSVFTENEKRELALGLQALLTVPILGEGMGLNQIWQSGCIKQYFPLYLSFSLLKPYFTINST